METSRNHVKSPPLRLSGWSVVNIIIDSCRCHVASEGERGEGLGNIARGYLSINLLMVSYIPCQKKSIIHDVIMTTREREKKPAVSGTVVSSQSASLRPR